MNRVLVTGGVGLLGSAVVQRLTEDKNISVVVVDSLLYETDYLAPIIFHRGSVGNLSFMKDILREYAFDTVIHLAAVVGDPACAARPIEAREANIKSLEILRDNFDGRIIWPSSCSVYGVHSAVATELSPLSPLSLYAEMKVEGEKILEGTNSIIFRLATLHGVTQRLRTDLVVNAFVVHALKDKKINVFGGNQSRPLIHVHDVVDTIIYHMNTDTTGVFNLVKSNNTISDIAHQIAKACDAEVVTTEMPSEDKRDYKVSAEKAKVEWGFCPVRDISTTVDQITVLHNEGRIKDYSHSKYSNILTLRF